MSKVVTRFETKKIQNLVTCLVIPRSKNERRFLVLTLFPERVLAIEKIINSKMTEFELEEEKIIKILARFKICILVNI